jgi:hypothetical protein
MALFGPKLPIDEDELSFQLATFKWLGDQFGPVTPETPLVTPTRQWFTGKRPRDDDEMRTLFDEVRTAAGMADWPCELKAGETSPPVDAGNAVLIQHEGPGAPCGTFEMREADGGLSEADGANQALITYDPAMMDDPEGLIGTFAHELGHYLLASATATPPGGWDLHELHTDLAAVYLGFGIFMANGAKAFRTVEVVGGAGWQMSLRGYLSEAALVTALAIVERLAGRDPRAAAGFLKDYLRKDLNRATWVLERRHSARRQRWPQSILPTSPDA